MIAKDLIPGMGTKSFAIMERPLEMRPGRQSWAGMGNSRAPGDEQAMICPGRLADCGPAGDTRDRNWTPGSNGAEDPAAARWSGVGAEDEVAVHAAEPVGGRVGRERVAEVSGPDLADPLVVLVLVVDQGGQQVGGDDG